MDIGYMEMWHGNGFDSTLTLCYYFFRRAPYLHIIHNTALIAIFHDLLIMCLRAKTISSIVQPTTEDFW